MKTFFFISAILLSAAAFSQKQIEVYFDYDSHFLKDSAKVVLTNRLREQPTDSILQIEGFCDYRGSLQYNKDLALKRAQSVAVFVDSIKGSTGTFKIQSKGEEFLQRTPLYKNRKAVITFTQRQIPAQQPAASALSQKVAESKVGDKIKLENIHFFNMSDLVVPASRPRLGELLQIMKDNPKLKIEIQGHICCQKTKDSDLSNISTLRARAIYKYLSENGINTDRLSYKGYGVSRPIHPIPEKNDAQANENRRVEIEILSN